MEKQGLYPKYTIIKNSTGEEVKSPAFVLLPEKDEAARAAIMAYALAIEESNPKLAVDLRNWMGSIVGDSIGLRQKSSYESGYRKCAG